MTWLQIIWFCLIVVLFAGYAVLDGFDLGIGIGHLFERDESSRKENFKVIAPVWDGNEVWLITGVGALFAAFPSAYALILSRLYAVMIVLLLALAFRGIAIEVRGKLHSYVWKRFWDFSFGLGSVVIVLAIGVTIGNITQGFDQRGIRFDVTSFILSLLVCLVFYSHGKAYLIKKGINSIRNANIAAATWSFASLVFGLFVFISVRTSPVLIANFVAYPIAWLAPILVIILSFAVVYCLRNGLGALAFVMSSLTIVFMFISLAIGMFPFFVMPNDFNAGVNIAMSSSSPKTLSLMLIVASVGMPLVLVYSILIYRIFRTTLGTEENEYIVKESNA